MHRIDSTSSAGPVRDGLDSWGRDLEAARPGPLLEQYAKLVYSSAYRRTESAAQAAEVTRAVFLALARHGRTLRQRTVVPAWLWRVTAMASRKVKPRRERLAQWFKRRRRPGPDASAWERISPRIDALLDHLPARQRDAVILQTLLNRDAGSSSQALRTTPQRATMRNRRGLERLVRQLRRRRVPDAGALMQLCAAEGCAVPMPEGFAVAIAEEIAATKRGRPGLRLARACLRRLAWIRWRRRLAIGFAAAAILLAAAGAAVWQWDGRSGHSRLISLSAVWSARLRNFRTAERAQPWPANASAPRLDARLVRRAADIYQTTNIWRANLQFTAAQWNALAPKHFAPMPNFLRPEGLIFLRNPDARRSGVAGVLGYEFDWVHGSFEFGGVRFEDVAIRRKGNMAALLLGPKHPFKLDLNRFTKGQKLAGLDEMTFNNLVWDESCLANALGFEFFRDAGVPAPRTAYAWLTATVTPRWDHRPLGLYLMVESIDKAFIGERFGSRKAALFKPVTYTLFQDLGPDWRAYAGIYDAKTGTTPAQQQRVISFARLVTTAPDAEFNARVGEFLDLDEFARFLAGEVLLSNYDSILADGQNFYMYLDPRSNKFGFIPWDLDAAWGRFWLSTKAEFERASIWHPWVGENRFIERVMAVEDFRRMYRRHLEDFVTRLFVPKRLEHRIDEFAAILREPVGAESRFRLDRFDQAVGIKPVRPATGDPRFNIRPAHDLKGFIRARARWVKQQLDGKSKGMVLRYRKRE